jgi:AraC-like DNA-binding protein
MKRQQTAASWVRGVAELFAAEGLDVASVLAEAGIDAASLDAPGARVATEDISRLWDIAVARSGNDAIALAQGERPRPKSFDVVGYAMMSCANLRDALERLIRYLRLLSDALTIYRTEARGRYQLDFDLRGGTRPVPRQRVEFMLVTLLNFCRWVSARPLVPETVGFAFPAPRTLEPHRVAFGCAVSFDAEVTRMVFLLDDLSHPLPTSNPSLAALHDRFAGDYLQHFEGDQTSHRVREVLVARLPDGEPHRDEVARALAMSERTLQRRLADEGTSFGELLDDTRRELAEQYLQRMNLSLAQAGFLLGFADQTSFVRACKRWFGVPPGQYRRRLQ